MAEGKNKVQKSTNDREGRRKDAEKMPRRKATQEARKGRWGRPGNDNERFGHSPAANGTDDDKNK
jgi:hypothetical protein